ncbi:MAG: patatin-like protein, partial [Fimbriimonadaceae bacterium]|nr:patatin-like protein [Alphaproteobacteria bacterium]
PELDLRVVIDVIAGSSAGGVNGIMLARALAHDLNLDGQRHMWLENADILHLMDTKASAGRWSKFYIRPFVALAMQGRLGEAAPEKETRDKLSLFLRSRWFHPPFSGPRFSSWLFEANQGMEQLTGKDHSLLPTGHALDLFVSITDFYGHANKIAIHDPLIIEEREHRHVLHFNFSKSATGEVKSDFGPESVPGLVFAARATSCFPGAFPAASLREIDIILARRRMTWPTREAFIAEKFKGLVDPDQDPANIRFVDGSVVNDKPFGVAIGAITGRPAHRQVMRRIVFVEPNPIGSFTRVESGEPGFFRMILSSLAEIPRNEPIHDELARINEFNDHIKLLRQVVREVQPTVDRFVDRILPASTKELRPSEAEISLWRSTANDQAASEAGYAFRSYFRLKVLKVAQRLEHLTGSVVMPPGHQTTEPQQQTGFFAALRKLGARGFGADVGITTSVSESEIEFLKKFDVDFRVRRLRFVIRKLNELYRIAMGIPEIGPRTEWIDDFKEILYGHLAEVKKRWDPDFYSPEIASGFRDNEERTSSEGDAYAATLSEIGDAMGLEKVDAAVDEIFAFMVLNSIPAEMRHELYAAYIGFPFFDVLSFPMMQWEDLDEFEEILIDRISPIDATAIRSGGTREILRGTSMRRFGGFFNRSYRENDYLWGRLNAADRLVDIILGAIGESACLDQDRAAAIKHRLFIAILDAEEPFLKADPDLLKTIREEIKTES